MDALSGRILGFVLVLTRVGAFVLIAPIFNWQTIPQRIKISVVIIVSLFLTGVYPYAAGTRSVPTLQAALLIANEVIYGASLGLISSMLFSTVWISARIVGREMGLAMANILDPVTGQSSQPLSVLIEIVFILLFLSANGHHMLLAALARSYESFPIGSTPELELLVRGVVTAGSTMLALALKMAAPILTAFLLTMVVLAVMARVAPESNILFLSFPLRVGLGLLMVGVFLPFILAFVKELAGYMDRLLPL